jgi:hypothetical protein
MNRFALVRELVKDPSLRVTDIARKTGYNKGHVSRLRKEAIKQGSDYERGVVDGMQRQMQSSVDKAINRQPTKILGPNLEQVLNSAGYYKKREWLSLTDQEVWEAIDDVLEGGGWLDVARTLEQAFKEKNT